MTQVLSSESLARDHGPVAILRPNSCTDVQDFALYLFKSVCMFSYCLCAYLCLLCMCMLGNVCAML